MDINESNVQHLNNVKTLDLLEMIYDFKKLTPRTASQSKIRECLEKIIIIRLQASITMPCELYRIRRNTTNEPFLDYNDYWNPTENIKKNRLNKLNEPMLYVSLDPVIPFHEAKITPDEYFTLIFYKCRPNMTISAFLLEGVTMQHRDKLKELGLNENGLTNYYILSDFIRTELMRDVGEGMDYIYDITSTIKNLFDVENKERAFVYSSTYNYNRLNCAIKPEYAKQALYCSGFFFGKLAEIDLYGEAVSINARARYSNEIKPNEPIRYEKMYGDGRVILRMNNESGR